VRIVIGVTISGVPDQMTAVDGVLQEIGRRQPTWGLEVGRSSTIREARVRVMAHGLDEAMFLVRTEVEELLLAASLDPAPELSWARPRQVQI
jgi:hypothetical protein